MVLQQNGDSTVAIKACGACGAALLEVDKFCRRCGAVQPDQLIRSQQSFQCSAEAFGHSNNSNSSRDVYHRVSGPLVSAVVTGALTGHQAEVSPAIQRAMLALIWIPIWLIIVLLSPLDAYSAVKTLARQT